MFLYQELIDARLNLVIKYFKLELKQCVEFFCRKQPFDRRRRRQRNHRWIYRISAHIRFFCCLFVII